MMVKTLDVIVLVATSLYLSFIVVKYRSKRRARGHHPFPPTPKGIPILGNALQIPAHEPWLAFRRMSEELKSDIIHLNAAGESIIVLNNLEDARELLEKRSAKYSSRRHAVMANELMGWGWLMSGLPYDIEWRERRRLLQKHFPRTDTQLVESRSEEYVHRLLTQLHQSPENFLEHIKHLVGGLAFSLAYGIRMESSNDPHIRLAEEALEPAGRAITPGAYLVDVFPFLKHVPAWFPGAQFKRDAKVWRGMMERFRNDPYELAEREILSHAAKASLTSMALDDTPPEKLAYRREMIKDTAGMFFTAGFDTTKSTLTYFILLMTCFPEVQAKAHRELDAVVRSERLPDFGDQEELPYISAIVEELLRWQPAAGLAIPHYSTADDIYRGYFIPNKSIVIANVWGILHDERHYPEPHLFVPERYLDEGQFGSKVPLPSTVAFGFGRRLCPGLHIATAATWLTVATVLATFHLSKAKGKNGELLEPDLSCEPGIVTRVKLQKDSFENTDCATDSQSHLDVNSKYGRKQLNNCSLRFRTEPWQFRPG